jgi:hypothetical protein
MWKRLIGAVRYYGSEGIRSIHFQHFKLSIASHQDRIQDDSDSSCVRKGGMGKIFFYFPKVTLLALTFEVHEGEPFNSLIRRPAQRKQESLPQAAKGQSIGRIGHLIFCT